MALLISGIVFETGEVVSLVIALIGYFILLIEFKNHKNLLHLFVAYSLLLVGAIATVVETVYLPDVFNLVEHLAGRALVGIAFGLMAFLAYKKVVGIEKSTKIKIGGKK